MRRKEMFFMKKMIMILVLCFVIAIPCEAKSMKNDSQNQSVELFSKSATKYIGDWYTVGKLAKENPWAFRYVTTFKKDGTVALRGYRNKDFGKYKVVNKNKLKATFNKHYTAFAGANSRCTWHKTKKYTYTVVYTYNAKKHTLYAKYSKKFFDKGLSNAGNGNLKKR